MIKALYSDIQKAPYFNALLALTVLSLQVSRGGFYFFLSLILLFFLADLAKHWKTGSENIKSIIFDLKHISAAFFLVIITMTLSNLTTDYSNITAWIYEIKFILKVPIFLIVLLYFYKKGFFTPQLLYFFIVSSILLHALDGAYQAFSGYDVFRGHEGTLCEGLTGATKNRNDFGFLIGFGIFLILGLTFNAKNHLERWSYTLCGMLIMFCTLYSLSRAAWLAILTSLSFLLLYKLSKTNFKHSFFILFYMMILVGSSLSIDCLTDRTTSLIESTSLVGTEAISSTGASSMNEAAPTSSAKTISLAETTNSIGTTSLPDTTVAVGATHLTGTTASVETTSLTNTTSLITQDMSTYERIEIWSAVIEMIASKPILGWGMEKIYQFGSFSNHTHNVALEIALHTGLLGLLAFLYCLYQACKTMINNKQIMLLTILVYLLIKCLLDHTLFSGNFVPASLVAILFYTYSEDLRVKLLGKHPGHVTASSSNHE